MKGQSAINLSYSVRLTIVLKYLGRLCLLTAILSFAPLIISLMWEEYEITYRYCLVILALFIFGGITRKIPSEENMQPNEAFAIVGLIFLLTSFVMTYPMMGAGLSFMDAWFESVSAITTTGLSTVGNVENKLKTFLFARSWMQWYGGLGIVIFALGLATQPSIVSKKLSLTITDSEETFGGTRIFARKMFLIYFLLSLACFFVLWFFGPSIFDALVITLSTVSTGGFSPYNASIADFTLPMQATITMFSVMGSISLPLYWIARKKVFNALLGKLQPSIIFFCALIGTALLTFFMVGPFDFSFFQNALFSAFSAQSTTGFATIDISILDNASKLVLIASMMVGGSTHSTAGGFKVLRLLILLRGIQLLFLKTSLSKHAVYSPSIAGEKLQSEERESALGVIFLFFATIFISWLFFLAAGYDPMNSFFEVVSATGTVGLSTGITNPELPSFLKGVLCMDMFLGRLEFVTFLIIFYPRTFVGRRMH